MGAKDMNAAKDIMTEECRLTRIRILERLK